MTVVAVGLWVDERGQWKIEGRIFIGLNLLGGVQKLRAILVEVQPVRGKLYRLLVLVFRIQTVFSQLQL